MHRHQENRLQHPVGTLSPTGVLDVGLRCPHSCVFCYYSHFDGHEDPFHALRTLPFRPLRECTDLADDFQRWGLTHCDVTGGEPSLHPQILELIHHIEHVADVRARMITLGQFTMRPHKPSGRERLVDALLDAGLTDFLFSFHAASEARFKQLTKASLAQVKATMEYLDACDFSYTSNTVVQQYNASELPEIARYLAQRNIRFHNFIVMKLEWGWRNGPDHGVDHKARYDEIAPFLRDAVHILEDAGKAVNIRYAPYCSLPGLEKNIVGYKQVQLDPYEWRNGTRGGKIEGTPYGAKPFLFYERLDEYLAQHPEQVATHPEYNMQQGPPCESCALHRICDGVDRDYIARHGWGEFSAYPGETIEDLTHFRTANPRPFELLQRRDWPEPREKSEPGPREPVSQTPKP
ncbi:MAG: radical SAM protein [Deltaproteobacteria bacterium]|nr:radical SAM protein [Deltaproteobacteria bacterium]MBW2397288.1 radical SAM protein [Deltaproteobacteria bacterium]